MSHGLQQITVLKKSLYLELDGNFHLFNY